MQQMTKGGERTQKIGKPSIVIQFNEKRTGRPKNHTLTYMLSLSDYRSLATGDSK